MKPPHDCNPTIWMWKRFVSSVILRNIFFEYFKLVELAIILILKSVEDEHAFFIITFMKSKLKNHLTTNVDLVVKMYVYDFLNFVHISIPWQHHKLEWSKIPIWVGTIEFWSSVMRRQPIWRLHGSYLLCLNTFIILNSIY